jgi:hypothetical protein
MSEIVVFTCAGLILLILLRISLWRSEEEDELRKPPSRALMQRVLAREDLEYARQLGSPRLLRLLLRERRRLALGWIDGSRREAVRIFRDHFRMSRHYSSLRPQAELALTANFMMFLMVCDVLRLLVWALGPFRTRHVFACVRSLSEVLAGLGEAMAGRAAASAFRVG